MRSAGIKAILFDDWTLSVVWLVILLLAIVTFFISWESPVALQQRSARLLREVQSLQRTNVDDTEVEHALMVSLMQGATDSHWTSLVRHVSLALFVSCILMLAVEIHTRRVARADLRLHLGEISSNVFAGVAKRLIGDGISRELDLILRQDFAKRSCGYRVTFQAPLKPGSTDWVVVLVENWYEIRKLSESCQNPFQFEATLIGQETAEARVANKDFRLPRFQRVVINEVEQRTEELKDSVKLPLEILSDAKRPMKVYLAIQIACRTHSFDVMFSEYAVETSTFEVVNLIPDLVGKIEVSVLHPAYREVISEAQGEWLFNRCLLPGQGWYLSWKPAGEPPKIAG